MCVLARCVTTNVQYPAGYGLGRGFSRQRLLRPGLIPVLVLIAACEPAMECVPVVPGVIDRGSVRIVDSRAPLWDAAIRWSVDPDPALQIGAAEGDAAYQFSDPWGAIELPDGRIVVTDGQVKEVRIFGPDGRHIRTFGGEGEGPGEFRMGPDLVLAGPDTLLAWDPRAWRMSWFDDQGTLLRTQSLGPALRERTLPGRILHSVTWRLAPDGSLLLVGDEMQWEGERGWSTQPVVLFPSTDEWSGPAIEIGEFPSRSYTTVQQRLVLTHPFGSVSSIAFHPDPFAVHVSDPECWQVTGFGPDGGVQAIFRAAVPRLPITPDLMEIVRDSFAVRASRNPVVSSPEAFSSALAQFDIPDSISAIGAMHTDTEGNLWVLRRTSRYQPDEPLADVLDPDGRWLGTVRLPDGIERVLSIGTGNLIVLWRDALDVPYIRVHRIQKPEDSAGD
jgi:hypothetical protein